MGRVQPTIKAAQHNPEKAHRHEEKVQNRKLLDVDLDGMQVWKITTYSNKAKREYHHIKWCCTVQIHSSQISETTHECGKVVATKEGAAKHVHIHQAFKWMLVSNSVFVVHI